MDSCLQVKNTMWVGGYYYLMSSCRKLYNTNTCKRSVSGQLQTAMNIIKTVAMVIANLLQCSNDDLYQNNRKLMWVGLRNHELALYGLTASQKYIKLLQYSHGTLIHCMVAAHSKPHWSSVVTGALSNACTCIQAATC